MVFENTDRLNERKAVRILNKVRDALLDTKFYVYAWEFSAKGRLTFRVQHKELGGKNVLICFFDRRKKKAK